MSRIILGLACLVVISLLFVGSGDAAIDPASAVGIWLLDEGEGDTVKDDSGKGNDGEFGGGAEWDKGQFGSAVRFDGSSGAIDCGDDPSLHIEQGTMVCWQISDKIVGNTGQSSVTLPYDDGGAWDAPWRTFGLGIWDKQLRYWIAINGQNMEIQPGIVDAEQWYHLAITFDGDTRKAFLDGKELAAVPGAGILEYGDPLPRCVIGGRSLTAPGEWFVGIVDEAAIFDVALEQKDIEDIMENGLAAAVGLSVSPQGKLTTSWGFLRRGAL